jgi:RND superfamily putative drug exporter
VRFGTADERQLPATAESRVVSDTIRERYPSGSSGAVSVVARAPDTPSGTAALESYARRLSELPGAKEVQTPIGTFAAGRLTQEKTAVDALRRSDGLAFLQVQAAGRVEDVSARSEALARAVRGVPAPFPALATSPAASLIDTKDAIGRRLGVALALVVVTTMVLIFLLTGSLVLPLLAVALNALSLSVMFGAAVWVFQDGHFAPQLGFTPTGFVDTSLPVLMFCLAFGLSMDYGLFVLARITEEHDRGAGSRGAVVLGLTRTGATITAAATILAVVLVAIAQSRITNTMMLGWGAALAVLVDATLVRGVLLPAVLGVLGRAAWWAPAPLRRLHGRVALREAGTVPEQGRPPQQEDLRRPASDAASDAACDAAPHPVSSGRVPSP